MSSSISKKSKDIIITRGETKKSYNDVAKKYPGIVGPGIYFKITPNFIKIGKSKNILFRHVKTFTDVPDDSVRIVYYNCPERLLSHEESIAHTHFQRYHSGNGEWFNNFDRREMHKFIEIRREEILNSDPKWQKEFEERYLGKTDNVNIKIERRHNEELAVLDPDNSKRITKTFLETRPNCFFYPYKKAQLKDITGGKFNKSETWRSYYADEVGYKGVSAKALIATGSAYMAEGQRVRLYTCYEKHLELMNMRRVEKERMSTYDKLAKVGDVNKKKKK